MDGYLILSYEEHNRQQTSEVTRHISPAQDRPTLVIGYQSDNTILWSRTHVQRVQYEHLNFTP